jgi:L-2-hydroxycarboxylate dehydrogenase (NAD+)
MWRSSTALARGALRPLARALRTSRPAAAEVPIADLHELGAQALGARGYAKQDTDVLLDVMLWSHLREGGAPRAGLAALASGALAPPVAVAGNPVEYETKLSARLDGQKRAGMLVMHNAVELAVQKAQQSGVGLVGTRNVGSSAGALGYFLESIANAGYVGLVFAQTPAATGTAGASPLGISVPSPRGPVVLDAATAAATVLGVGAPPSGAGPGLSDTLAVFDRSYKGSHLSVMVELLAGPLVGGGADASGYGNLILAFDPELLGDRRGFQRDVEAVLQRLQPGAAGRVPGEAQAMQLDASLRNGRVAVDDSLLAELRSIAAGGASATPAASGYDRTSWGMGTRLAHPAGKGKGDPYNASSPVLYQTATFELDATSLSGDYDYSRSGNPTRHSKHTPVAHARRAFCRSCSHSRALPRRAPAHTPAPPARSAPPAPSHPSSDLLPSRTVGLAVFGSARGADGRPRGRLSLLRLHFGHGRARCGAAPRACGRTHRDGRRHLRRHVAAARQHRARLGRRGVPRRHVRRRRRPPCDAPQHQARLG